MAARRVLLQPGHAPLASLASRFLPQTPQNAIRPRQRQIPVKSVPMAPFQMGRHALHATPYAAHAREVQAMIALSAVLEQVPSMALALK